MISTKNIRIAFLIFLLSQGWLCLYSNPCLFTLNPSSTPASCFGSTDGSATITVVSGGGNYSYNWSTGASSVTSSSSSQITNLGSGTYTVTVTDITASCTS